ncbi:hypothetical protein MG293_012095 [Ovis ammon polii]|uniref:Cytochrome b5 heme-binding domain-containing protein n=1 Tax=Ovis ammon polii TaxID=230172 RepID=A0AAD4U2Q7_OVIAM|nr:hypothetical protein MG293_012095 [Ovis ammon polii]
MTFEEKPEGNGSLIDENQLDLGAKHQPNGKPGASGKAKLSARQEANAKCDLPRKSLNTYTWQEIQRHNQKTDQWLVINRKVYDVTGWADRHPGGRKVLHCYAGEDATDVFGAMHPDPDIVWLYLKPLLIGELAPEEPNQERNKNTQLVEDFQELRRTLETLNMFNANLGFFFLHLAQILILEALAWGLSAKWWNNRLSQHHVKTNIYPKDPDIKVGPFFVIGDLQPVKSQVYKIINEVESLLQFIHGIWKYFANGLFPTMPRHNYHKVAPLVKSPCAKHGLPYVKKPMMKAFGDILRALKKSAALWMDAYYSHPET